MTDWQERITRGTPPAVRVEHDVRYRLAAPRILEGAGWCDLGCGNGLAAAAALGDAYGGRAVLVDLDHEAAGTAAREVQAGETVALAADLTAPEDVERVLATLLEGAPGPRTVTCFEVVEHLATFVPLLEALVALRTRDDVDVVLSVPNDAFWAIENPHHRTMWGEGAFEELRSLLPPDAVVLRQIVLSGSVAIPLDPNGEGTADVQQPVEVDAAAAVPTHLLAAFGPRAGSLQVTAGITALDLDGQRRWEREREAANAVVHEQTEVIERYSRWFAEWRTYIHDLETRLGLPLSGARDDESPPAAADAAVAGARET